jgi:hypothetical protein
MSDKRHQKSNDYPRRGYDPRAREQLIANLISKLTELERKTDPAGGAATASGKDIAAFQALTFAGNLVRALAGWALDHQVGLARQDLEFVPLQPSQTKEHPEYLRSRAIVDDHAHERAGALFSTCDLIPSMIRKALINLLRANPGGFDFDLQYTLLHALRALDFDEVHPILRPTRTDRKRNLTELQLQLWALVLVEYRRGRGKKKEHALQEVASAMGVSKDTIRSWVRRLRSEFGPLEVERNLAIARNAASNEEYAQKQSFVGGRTDGLGQWESQYGEPALRRLAEIYKIALKNRVALKK